MIIVGLFYICVCVCVRVPMSKVPKTIFSLYINGVEDEVCGFETHFVYLYCGVLSVCKKDL